MEDREGITPEEQKALNAAYKKYADSHTIWDNIKTGSILDDLPRIIPQVYGKTQFFMKCLDDNNFFNKWKI